MTRPGPVHPNERLSGGRGHRDPARRQRVRELVSQVDPETGLPLLTFAAIADELGISRERVRQLAWEEARVRGMVKRKGKGKGKVELRGQRRVFEKKEPSA